MLVYSINSTSTNGDVYIYSHSPTDEWLYTVWLTSSDCFITETLNRKNTQKFNTNLKFSFSSFSCLTPSCFLFCLHSAAPGVSVLQYTHLGQTSCFQRSQDSAVPLKNQSHVFFFLPKIQKIKNKIYWQNSNVSLWAELLVRKWVLMTPPSPFFYLYTKYLSSC